MKKGLTTLVAAIVIFDLIAIIGSAAADPTPPQVTNASANPPVIAVNTDITELRVDAAGIESPIDVVTVDLSPIGGNATTVMFNIGNYTQDNISWTMYNYTTNASVEGTFNLTVNATDINGNCNDTVSIMLDVKKTVIHFTTFPAMTYISNISVDANVLGNVGKNATTEQFTSTEEIDNETYYIVNTTKPVGSTEMYVGVDEINEDLTMKRRVREREPGVEVANLTYDPEFVSRDFPLWVGKNWTTTANVTGVLVNRTGAEILIDTIAVVSGEVTDEVNLTVPYGTIHCLVVEVNVNLQDPSVSFLTRYWMGYDETNEMIIIPKSQRYSNENLMEELELINAQSSIEWHTSYQEGMQIAGSQDKPTMIFFESSNCPACKKQKEVLADARVINMSKIFVPIVGSGRLGGQYGIHYIPTIVFTNSQGEEVYRIVGYRDADTLVEEMRQALKSSNLIVMPPMFPTAADDGSEIELKKGQLLVITLEANPTTGYTWEVAEPLDERAIRQVGEIEFVPESDLIGAGGVQIIRSEGVGADQTTIKLVYHRPWETEVELTLGTFSVQVVVR